MQVETDEMAIMFLGCGVFVGLYNKFGALGNAPADKLFLYPLVLCIAVIMGFGGLPLPLLTCRGMCNSLLIAW